MLTEFDDEPHFRISRTASLPSEPSSCTMQPVDGHTSENQDERDYHASHGLSSVLAYSRHISACDCRNFHFTVFRSHYTTNRVRRLFRQQIQSRQHNQYKLGNLVSYSTPVLSQQIPEPVQPHQNS
jgi:hypothetical protein